MQVEFELEKETAGTYRFKEVVEQGRPPVIKTLYVQKWALSDTPVTETTKLIVTIEPKTTLEIA